MIGNRIIKIDDELTIDLKGYSKKGKSQQLARVIRDIRHVERMSSYTLKGLEWPRNMLKE